MKINKKKIARAVLCAALTVAMGYSITAKALETKLIPFQGKLTDASGQNIKDGALVVQFKLYDAPVGGQAVWNGEIQKLSVNGGLVSTVLGTKSSLKKVDFSESTYLEITIDANNDGKIGPEDPPLLPRQSIIPAVFAAQSAEAKNAENAEKLGGYDWSVVFADGDPQSGIPGEKLKNGSIPASKIENKSITASQIADSTITSAKIANGAVTSSQIASGAVTSNQLGKGAVTSEKIAEKSITTGLMAERKMVDASKTAAPVGSIACSEGVKSFATSVVIPNYEIVPGLSLKIKTSGRPVMIMLQEANSSDASYFKTWGGGRIQLHRGDVTVKNTALFTTGQNVDWYSLTPSSSIIFIDTPPAGEHHYSIYAGREWPVYILNCYNMKLVAFEL